VSTAEISSPALSADDRTLHEVIEALAPLSRRAGSEGEHRAACWIAERLQQAGCDTALEEERFLDGYAKELGSLAAASAVAGAAALTRPLRRPAAVAAALVAAAIADDVSNGPRLYRRAAAPSRTTWNVVGSCGDTDAERTLVVLAHHDAAPTGAIFDERALAWLGDHIPGIIERIDTSVPFWWALLSAPSLIALGAALSKRPAIRIGIAGSLIGTAALADVHRRPVAPGANDNLTGVAVLVALAERLAAQPIVGVRVLLVSCGAEEVLQGGIHGFAARHFRSLDRERTWFLNVDTVGSPKLILIEGEGPVVMEDYHDRTFRDLIARAAERVGAPLRRGMRSRSSTDAVIPNRAGYPTATIASIDRNKALSNYHRMTDTPENVDYTTVAQALSLTEAVARELGDNPWLAR
jgi:hypothetical protein